MDAVVQARDGGGSGHHGGEKAASGDHLVQFPLIRKGTLRDMRGSP